MPQQRLQQHTELLLDDLQDLLLIELLGETLDSGQGLSTIALCKLQPPLASFVAHHPTTAKISNSQEDTYVGFVYECNFETV